MGILQKPLDKCEPEQQYRLGTVSYKITGGLKPVLQVPNLTLSFCSGSQHLVSFSVLVGTGIFFSKYRHKLFVEDISFAGTVTLKKAILVL